MYKYIERGGDIVLSLVFIVLFSPIMLVLAILVYFDETDSHSVYPLKKDMPVHIGLKGKPFFMKKFRSMIPNAWEVLQANTELYEKYRRNNNKLGIDEDPRITKIGKFIRATSIDELPQFFDVLQGNMSIVGPRPYFKFEIDEYWKEHPKTREDIKKILSVKPGITGEWQVGGRSTISFNQRIKMDAEYVDRKSFIHDMLILLKTPMAIIKKKGVI